MVSRTNTWLAQVRTRSQLASTHACGVGIYFASIRPTSISQNLNLLGLALGESWNVAVQPHKKHWCPVSTFTCFCAGFITKTLSQGAPPKEHSKITILHGIGCSLNLSISYYCLATLSMGQRSIGKLCHMSGHPLLQKVRTEAIMVKEAQIQ